MEEAKEVDTSLEPELESLEQWEIVTIQQYHSRCQDRRSEEKDMKHEHVYPTLSEAEARR